MVTRQPSSHPRPNLTDRPHSPAWKSGAGSEDREPGRSCCTAGRVPRPAGSLPVRQHGLPHHVPRKSIENASPATPGRQTADSVISYEVGLEPIDLPRATGGLGRNTLQSQPIAPHSDHAGAPPIPAPVTTAIGQRTAPHSRMLRTEGDLPTGANSRVRASGPQQFGFPQRAFPLVLRCPGVRAVHQTD
jgi:hypothetical protein